MTEQSNPQEIIPGTTEPIGPVFDLDTGKQIGLGQVSWYSLEEREEANTEGEPLVANMAQDPPEGMHYCGVVLQLPPDFSKDDLPPLLSLDELQTRAFLGAFLGYQPSE